MEGEVKECLKLQAFALFFWGQINLKEFSERLGESGYGLNNSSSCLACSGSGRK